MTVEQTVLESSTERAAEQAASQAASGRRSLGLLSCFAVTTFLSAFLLFQVQPLISKAILPWFGGTSNVWTTCMLFFQTVLFAGYLYAHVTTERLSPRAQGVVHGLLALLAIALLPVLPAAIWKPDGTGHPTAGILLLLAAHVGLPYFLLASTSPLIQVWWNRAAGGGSPYRLYALSNAGSLIALISFPLVFEPLMPISVLGGIWATGFGLFVVSVMVCGYSFWRRSNSATNSELPIPLREVDDVTWESVIAANRSTTIQQSDAALPLTLGKRLMWIGLAAAGSIMLLATTNHICHDIAVVPLLWVAPLSIYLLTFILCFAGRGYPRTLFMAAMLISTGYIVLDQVQVTAKLAEAIQSVTGAEFQWITISGIASNYLVALGVFLFAMFACCMVCHGELWRLKPAPERLTSFYLYVAFGGALGGVFVGVLGPLLLSDYYELSIGMALCWFLSLVVLNVDRESPMHGGRPLWAWAALSGCYCILAGFLLGSTIDPSSKQIARVRNFYGVLTVEEAEKSDLAMHHRTMVNGLVLHGLQFCSDERRRVPTTYYAPESGVGISMSATEDRIGRRVGIVGLGVGTVAAHAIDGDALRIYEIDPAVIQFADEYFTFLQDCRGKCDVVLGDARISLERELQSEQVQRFDVLALDAFSGDAIPVHLLTREAFDVYLRHLVDGPGRQGILAVHISNNYLNLLPVLQGLADHYDLDLGRVIVDENEATGTFKSEWVLASRRHGLKKLFEDRPQVQRLKATTSIPLWTDDFTNILRVLER